MSENEIRAIAVREVAGYIERIHRPGLVNLVTVLMDLEAAAARMEQGMTARGSLRTAAVAEEPEWEYGVGWRWNETIIAFPTITRTAAEDYIERHPEDLDFGSHVLVQREPERPAGPWVPVKQEGAVQ